VEYSDEADPEREAFEAELRRELEKVRDIIGVECLGVWKGRMQVGELKGNGTDA
jgi:hypothetical protein